MGNYRFERDNPDGGDAGELVSLEDDVERALAEIDWVERFTVHADQSDDTLVSVDCIFDEDLPALVASRGLSAFTYQVVLPERAGTSVGDGLQAVPGHAATLAAMRGWGLPVEPPWRRCDGTEAVTAFCQELAEAPGGRIQRGQQADLADGEAAADEQPGVRHPDDVERAAGDQGAVEQLGDPGQERGSAEVGAGAGPGQTLPEREGQPLRVGEVQHQG